MQGFCVYVQKCLQKLSPVSFSGIKLLLPCLIESQTVIKRDYVLEKPKHDQKQICVRGEHTHAQFTHIVRVRFSSIEAMIYGTALLSAFCISY